MVVVDEVLGQQARHHRLADAAFFATDQVDGGQGGGVGKGVGHEVLKGKDALDCGADGWP
jgi:hypothetical protein